MSSVDGMYRIILEQQAEDRARAQRSHLVRSVARSPRTSPLRAGIGTALIRLGNRLAPAPAVRAAGVER